MPKKETRNISISVSFFGSKRLRFERFSKGDWGSGAFPQQGRLRHEVASNHSKKYTYRSEPKQISFRVSESEFAKLKQSAEALQMSVPAFVKAKAQNARLVTPKVAPDIAQAIARDLAKAGGNINQIAKWCNTHQHDVAPGDAQRLSENLKIMQKELQKIWQQLR